MGSWYYMYMYIHAASFTHNLNKEAMHIICLFLARGLRAPFWYKREWLSWKWSADENVKEKNLGVL